jgi:hypothetical protein
MEEASSRSRLETLEDVYEKIRSQLRDITEEIALRRGVKIEGMSFGSSVRRDPKTNTRMRKAHDIDYRIVAPDEETAKSVASDFMLALKQSDARDITYEIATQYGNCPRIAYSAHVGDKAIPVEVFFENKKNKTGMFGGMSNDELRHKRSGDSLAHVSRAQDIRTLMISLLKEAETGAVKNSQRYLDLVKSMNEKTPDVLSRIDRLNRAKLDAWLSAGNPELEALVERNRGRIDEMLQIIKISSDAMRARRDAGQSAPSAESDEQKLAA